MEESVLELVMPEASRPIAGLLLIAQHPLCHPQKMKLMKLMKLILTVHLVLLVVLVEAEPLGIITTGGMQMMLWILQIGMPQLVARSCYLPIGNQALLHIRVRSEE